MGYPDEEARGAAAARRSVGRRPTPRSTRRRESCLRSSSGSVPRRAAAGRTRSPSPRSRRRPRRSGRPAREPNPRRDVGRRRLLGRGGAPRRAGPRRRRRLDAPPRRRRHVLRVQEELLLARRRRRCPARRRPARHPVLRHEPRARVRGGRARAVPGRLPRRPDAEPVHRLQHEREVRGAARPGASPVRLRGRRDRPLRAARGRRRPTAAGALARAADEDKDQTYFLYGLRQDQLWHAASRSAS